MSTRGDFFLGALGAGLLALATAAGAANPQAGHGRFSVDPDMEVRLSLGWKPLDLAFDGSIYHVFGQDNDIRTAHDSRTYTFVDSQFRTVFFEPGSAPDPKLPYPRTHSPNVFTEQGGDHQLMSVRLLMNTKQRTSYVVVAIRDTDRTFTDSRPVTLELFKLESPPGTDDNPPEVFQLENHFRTTRCYTDANDALATELGLSDGKGGYTSKDLSSPCTP